MNRSRGAAKATAFILALVALCAVAPDAFAQAGRKTVTVATTKELLKAIAPNVTIVLKKGEYKLSAAYDVASEYVKWNDTDDGKELALMNLSNTVIRGADGAKLISDLGQAYFLGIYDSSSITFDNLAFVRKVADDVEVSAGGIYAEGVSSLAFDRCAFSGPTGYPIELWECKDVSITRTKIEDATSGALYAGYSRNIEIAELTVRGVGGWPLLYLEESDAVRIAGSTFDGNVGGHFVEIYAASGYVENVVFSGCTFSGNEFEYFSGTEVLPVTESCHFVDNSFGEDWAENSVATSFDEYYGGDEGPAYYVHFDDGFGFSYPPEWELQEGDGGRLALFSPYEEVLVFYIGTGVKVPAKFEPAKQGKKLFADALAAYKKLLASESSLTVEATPLGDAYEAGGFYSADYSGTAKRADGVKAFARIRFFVAKGEVRAMSAFAGSESSLEPDGEADAIIASIEEASAD